MPTYMRQISETTDRAGNPIYMNVAATYKKKSSGPRNKKRRKSSGFAKAVDVEGLLIRKRS